MTEPEEHQYVIRRKARMAVIADYLRVHGPAMNLLELHAMVGDPADRSDFRKLLRRMEKDGLLEVEKAPGAPKGESPLTVRLLTVEAPDDESDADHASALPRAPSTDPVLKAWRTQYRSLCFLVRKLGEGGVHQAAHLRASLRKSDDSFFDTVVANLKKRGAVVSPSESTLSAHPTELQKVWDSEELLCSVAGWSELPHAQHISVLLTGGTLLEETLAVASLTKLLGHNLIKLRTGVHGEATNMLQRWAAVDPALLRFASEHGIVSRHVRAVERAEPGKRMALLERIVDEHLSLRTALSIADGSEMPDELPRATELRHATVDDEGYEDEPPPSAAGSDQKLDVLLKLVFGIAGDVSALRQRVDWLAKELGYEEKSA